MEARDTKIKTGVAKIDARLKELEDKKKALPKQEISGLSVKQNDELAEQYFKMDDLETKYNARKSELGMTEPEIKVAGHTPAEWKEGIKTQIALNNINEERRKLQEMKAELEKHYTEDHAVDEILAAL
jgi:DNA primase catalytic subunit